MAHLSSRSISCQAVFMNQWPPLCRAGPAQSLELELKSTVLRQRHPLPDKPRQLNTLPGTRPMSHELAGSRRQEYYAHKANELLNSLLSRQHLQVKLGQRSALLQLNG